MIQAEQQHTEPEIELDPEPELSLRERNRIETWWCIHRVASSLAMEHGLAGTTVEMIARQAGVSNRTFFNYFASKEDAILGVQDVSLPAEALETFQRSDADIFTRTVQLVAAVMATSTPTRIDHAFRKTLVSEFPELRSRLVHIGARTEALVEPILKQAYSEDPDTEAGDEQTPVILLMLARTSIHYAYSRFPAALGRDDSEKLQEAIETFRKVVRRSL